MPTHTNLNLLNDRVKAVDPSFVGCEVAWNDGQRGVTSSSLSESPVLSCFGNNITDVCLIAADGGALPFVRPDNLDELVGITTADKLFFAEKNGSSVSAHHVLATMTERASYMGYTSVDTKMRPQEQVVVRVQNVWVPMKDGETSREVAPGHYSYQTMAEDDPRNLIVLGTPDGISVHSDGVGIKKLMGHTVNPDESVNEHWHSVQPTELRVGECFAPPGPTARQEPGLASPVMVGFKDMGLRTNCFLVMSIPNQQKPPAPVIYRALSAVPEGLRSLPAEQDGESRSARVSLDEKVFGAATKKSIEIVRPAKGDQLEPIVVTIMLYHTVRGDADVVNVRDEDVQLGIRDIKSIYKMCDKTCKLSELPAMLHKLTKTDVSAIAKKKKMDPFEPKADALHNMMQASF